MKPSQQLYLLDGSSYIYRAYYGIRERATTAGLPTNAVFGFTRMLMTLLHEHKPDFLAVVFDPPRAETFRRKIYPNYKANRSDMPDELACQIPYIRQVLNALNIPALEVPGFEADDVIATLACRAAAVETEVTVVTGDKDLMQIVDERINLLDTMKNKRSGPQEVLERFGVPPELVADVLGLAGDTSDNIPGVPGIGEKTAADLIQRFGSLERVLRWKDQVKGTKRRENLCKFEEQARLSKTLGSVRLDVPLETTLSELQRQSPNLPKLLPLLHELEFETLALAFTPPESGIVEIYSDGSGRDSGPGGYGVILRYGEHEKELSGFEPVATSQRMELLAAIRGLEALTSPKRVRLFSDSQYLVRGMNEWLEGWIRDGRLDTPDALANQDLWQQLVPLSRTHQISWQWVRGHAGHPFNERCDKLAKHAVETGLQAANPPEKISTTEQTRPEPASTNEPTVDPIEDFSEFGTDDDQLRLC